jgi:antibiotic biosynthesis monooxygenase (ABM) superfamily enzyme
MIKVFLKRRVKPENYRTMILFLLDMRSAALHQPGYIMGETLVKGSDPMELLTVGTWISEEHWKAWSTSPERIALESMVDPLMEDEIETTIYSVPDESI